MKLLHTSDWHIGRALYGRKRHDEFEAFSSWLINTIKQNNIDVLLVAGDVFDNITPGNRSQEQYYRVISQAAKSCRHVVITAGNHDSPSFLNAPKELLKTLDIHVIGSISGDPADEVLVLNDENGFPELLVCAVPYLRDRDIRTSEAGESQADRERKLLEGIRLRYDSAAGIAEQKRMELAVDIPIIAMGHLFAAGGETTADDGVRELYVGSLVYVPVSVFNGHFDYVALGHLHVPQKVAGYDSIRYSGSPIPLSFGEAKQEKSVCMVEFSGRKALVQLIPVPVFQKLEQIKGDKEKIFAEIEELSAAGSDSWLEVIYEGEEIVTDLKELLEDALSGSDMELLRIRNSRISERIQGMADLGESLEELDVNEVFERCLDMHLTVPEQRDELFSAYNEIVASLHEDPNA